MSQSRRRSVKPNINRQDKKRLQKLVKPWNLKRKFSVYERLKFKTIEPQLRKIGDARLNNQILKYAIILIQYYGRPPDNHPERVEQQNAINGLKRRRSLNRVLDLVKSQYPSSPRSSPIRSQHSLRGPPFAPRVSPIQDIQDVNPYANIQTPLTTMVSSQTGTQRAPRNSDFGMKLIEQFHKKHPEIARDQEFEQAMFRARALTTPFREQEATRKAGLGRGSGKRTRRKKGKGKSRKNKRGGGTPSPSVSRSALASSLGDEIPDIVLSPPSMNRNLGEEEEDAKHFAEQKYWVNGKQKREDEMTREDVDAQNERELEWIREADHEQYPEGTEEEVAEDDGGYRRNFERVKKDGHLEWVERAGEGEGAGEGSGKRTRKRKSKRKSKRKGKGTKKAKKAKKGKGTKKAKK